MADVQAGEGAAIQTASISFHEIVDDRGFMVSHDGGMSPIGCLMAAQTLLTAVAQAENLGPMEALRGIAEEALEVLHLPLRNAPEPH